MLTRMRRGTTRIKAQQGSNMVEFALIAPLLFFLMFVIMELGILFWVNLTMQYAVREGTRYSITGQSNLDPALVNQQRYLAVIQRIKDSSMGLYSKLNPTISTSIKGISMSTPVYNSSMFGAPGDIVVLQINCVWPVVTPAWRLMALLSPTGKPCPGSATTAGKYTFCVAATMRNEAFL